MATIDLNKGDCDEDAIVETENDYCTNGWHGSGYCRYYVFNSYQVVNGFFSAFACNAFFSVLATNALFCIFSVNSFMSILSVVSLIAHDLLPFSRKEIIILLA